MLRVKIPKEENQTSLGEKKRSMAKPNEFDKAKACPQVVE